MKCQSRCPLSNRAVLLQESDAKRQRPEEGLPADGAAGEQSTERAAAASGEPAPPAFASAGAQDVSTINDTGDTMQHVQAAPAAQVRHLFLLLKGICRWRLRMPHAQDMLDVSWNAVMCKARFR